jgi:hypothetical protein
MKKYEKPTMMIYDINIEESILTGSIKYSSEEPDVEYEVLSKERNSGDDWGNLW